jgi:hypothetical protein
MLEIHLGGASTRHSVNVVSLAVSLTRGVDARGQFMSFIASAAVRENDAPLVTGRRRRKFTADNIARIKDWVAHGVRRDEIANRLEVTVGSLQVTCSRLGISLRKSANGALQPRIVQRSIEHIPEGVHPSQAKFVLLLKAQNREVAFDLRLHAGLIEELALEASVRGQSVADMIGTILRQVVRKDLVGELLRNGNPRSKV